MDATTPAQSPTNNARLAKHYAPGNLLAVIRRALKDIDKTPDTVTVDDLAPMDEFHVGSREATQDLLDPLSLRSNHHLLDIGCGLGGPARFIAQHYGSRVSGFDLTREFVDVGNEISKWMGLENKASLRQGDVMEMAANGNSFDGAYMIHVGMNIDDKTRLFQKVTEILKPGGFFAVFDLMRVDKGEIAFPVPWSATAATSFVVSPDDYQQALTDAGLNIVHTRNRHGFALEFYEKVKAKTEEEGPGAFGLHLLMGESTEERLTNAYQAIIDETIAPVEIVARKY